MSEQNVMEAPERQAAPEDFDGGDFASDFEGGSEDGGPAAGPGTPGMGQSKSSRRRRRKRKNKAATVVASDGADSVAPESGEFVPTPMVMEGESLALAASAAVNPQQARRQNPNGSNGNPGQQQQGGGQNKRWKKKFRDRREGRNDQPATEGRSDSSAPSNGGGFGSNNGYRQGGRPDNFGNLSGGFKRKGKSGGQQQGGRRDRSFVGPMDHSYREVNGNYSDSPPATIHVHGSARRSGHRHQGDSQPIDHAMPRAIPIPENAQTHIYLFVEDLFITAKIQETARKQGVKVAFLKNEKDAIAELTNGEVINKPALIVFDLNNANAKPLTLIPKLRTKLKRSASIIGFLSTIQGDLKAKAVEAGCDTVMPRAAFSQNLPNLLRRYGVEEEEEVNFNF